MRLENIMLGLIVLALILAVAALSAEIIGGTPEPRVTVSPLYREWTIPGEDTVHYLPMTEQLPEVAEDDGG